MKTFFIALVIFAAIIIGITTLLESKQAKQEELTQQQQSTIEENTRLKQDVQFWKDLYDSANLSRNYWHNAYKDLIDCQSNCQ